MPLHRNGRRNGGKIVESGENSAVCAVGAAGFALCAGCNGCKIAVTQTAFPPDTAVGIRRDRICRRAVPVGIPLRGKLRKDRLQIVASGQDRSSCTDRTAAVSVGSGRNRGLPRMTAAAFPPNPSVASGCNLRWQKRCIFLRIPLRRKLRTARSKRIFLCQHCTPRAIRTARSAAAAFDGCTVRMALFAAPPDDAVRTVGNLIRCERRILFVIPLRGKPRHIGQKIVDLALRPLFFAIWAAAPGASRIDDRLPCMPVLTLPPDLLMTAGADSLRSQREVFCFRPLGEQRLLSAASAIFHKGFAHLYPSRCVWRLICFFSVFVQLKTYFKQESGLMLQECYKMRFFNLFTPRFK